MLQTLEISGFKSFPKQTTLSFPYPITAIVGPNGSGKSNIVESIRWVLGEQSMKTLRGKKGEDLIWNGSPASPAGRPQVPRMGKASVTLVFDNTDKKIPLEFDEVIFSRKIFRDGMNEYYLNGSQVRLKDVVLLLAQIGLGETKHNIISQGEVDRMLLSSARERREMLEEALGLRVYRLKKNESERRLDATENNMRQVEALLREITPHLKFLRTQSEKAEKRGSVEGELKEFEKVYFAKEKLEIKEEREKNEVLMRPLREQENRVRKEIDALLDNIKEREKTLENFGRANADEKRIAEIEARRPELERNLGRLEARYEIEKERTSQPKLRTVDMRYIHEEIREFLSEVRDILENEDNMSALKSQMFVLVEDLGHLIDQIERGTIEEYAPNNTPALNELLGEMRSLEAEIQELSKKLETHESSRIKEQEQYRATQEKIREFDSILRAKQEEERDLALQLERLKFGEERVRVREESFLRDLALAGIEESGLSSVSSDLYEGTSSEDLKKRIERLRGKLDEIGGIDTSVVKEFQELEARHSFLSKELQDLKEASGSLKKLVAELDQHIKNDFREGFTKIKEEFHNYFRIIFGGGKASLVLMKPEPRNQEPEIDESDIEMVDAEEPAEEGIEIHVDLPRKRIKGLAMLSGGERALTSIALLFAITAVNPPPFLMLDETDAALDEANSQRYAAILRELAKKTQLILVTHNRETMKCARVLYGVTMGDDGVSKLLSLELEEAEEYTNR